MLLIALKSVSAALLPSMEVKRPFFFFNASDREKGA